MDKWAEHLGSNHGAGTGDDEDAIRDERRDVVSGIIVGRDGMEVSVDSLASEERIKIGERSRGRGPRGEVMTVTSI